MIINENINCALAKSFIDTANTSSMGNVTKKSIHEFTCH